jgi:hypothetical protein
VTMAIVFIEELSFRVSTAISLIVELFAEESEW